MKKKKIIIVMLSAVVIVGGIVGVAYALDGGFSAEPEAPLENTVLVKDDPSIVVDVPDTYMVGDMVFNYTEEEKIYLVEHERVRSVISDVIADVIAENPSLKDVHIGEDECIGMTKEQIKVYVDLIVRIGAADKNAMDEYPRVLGQVRGEIPLDAERMTVEELDEIISQSSSYDEMFSKIDKKYVADYAMQFSGVPGGNSEYWLDDERSQYIAFSSWWNEHCIYLCNGSDVTELYSTEELDAIFAAKK